ncbi:thiamine pyrophosphate-dependent enzyme [Agrobacterium sp. ES01]|uniref:thiamine pyrophosphate-dependent enzyme n=1 Tax=Agrobacterium sp. ES01 TaxID=3420714 RepID=UPI003D0FFCBB
MPAAIGGKIAAAEIPVAVSVGDGGFQFTLEELERLSKTSFPSPSFFGTTIVWPRFAYSLEQHGMMERNIPTIGVNQRNPDFGALAKACGCYTAVSEHYIELEAAVTNAFRADGPTVIHLRESAEFLA